MVTWRAHGGPFALERTEVLPGLIQGLAEYSGFEVHGGEEVTMGQEQLGSSHEEIAAVPEGEVEATEDFGLGFPGEVHEGIPAHEEMHAGDRRVLDEVVAAEDDGPAQVLVEDISIVDAIEVALEVLGRNVLHVLGGVARVARLGEGLVIDVGSVDFDAVAELIHPQVLHEDHGEGIRFLAGRTARTPHPDGAVRLGIGQDAGDDFGGHESPRLGVPEKVGDVDEDVVEEQTELFRMILQVALVLLVGGSAHDLQAFLDSPDEARPLVGGKVEAARLLEVLKKLLHPLAVI